jgi:monovalent cation:H+ antiporter-2, CPA2 family
VVQSAVATGLGAVVAMAFGWQLGAGIVLGLAISVASTVVLLRVLMDNDVLNTSQGHVAIGWLVVEDIFTVLVLVLLPVLASSITGTIPEGQTEAPSLIWALGKALLNLAVLTVLVLFGGGKAIPWLLAQVAKTRSRELFTLTVLVIALGVSAGSYVFFGASMALGAFLAGMVVGQSDVHHQAAADALPMRDAFAVLFFVSVGMLFDPRFLIQEPLLVLSVMGIILIGKPIAALIIVLVLGKPVRMALTVALALAQIGEFSFIVGEAARYLKILPDQGASVLVAGALLSITLNPILFRMIDPIENFLRNRPKLWKLLNARNKEMQGIPEPQNAGTPDDGKLRAVVIGYGPVGKTLTRILRDFDIQPSIVEMNVATVKNLAAEGINAVYGDAGRRDILEAAGIANAKYLLVTLPDTAGRMAVIGTARMLNPNIRILSRAHYVGEAALLEEAGASEVVSEEAEVAVALAETLLKEVGAEPEAIAEKTDRIRASMFRKHHVDPIDGAVMQSSTKNKAVH